jgi:hypothetical protein
MEICVSCHQKDVDAIKCDKPIRQHHYVGIFKCSICGEVKMVYICHKYHSKEIKRIENLRGG